MRIWKAGGRCVFDDSNGRFRKGQQPIFRTFGDVFTINAGGGNYYKNCRQEWATYFTTPQVPGFSSYRLAVTRSFGDLDLVPYGLITTPSVNVVAAPAPAVVRAVVIATDGLWDVMTDTDIGTIVRRPAFLESRNAQAAADILLESALVSGRKLFGQNQDNTTVVVLYL
jgi:hypothetical protein